MHVAHCIPVALVVLVGFPVAPIATCWGQSPAGPDQVVLCEDFEGELLDFHTYRARYSADTVRAHFGTHALRVTPTASSGGEYFRLDGVVDLESDYEFSAWVYAGAPESVRFYISASDGQRRHVKAVVAGGRAGQWVQLVGALRGKDWKAADTDVMLAMTCAAESWFDDVTPRKTRLPDPLYVTDTLRLTPDDDLRPGLRAYVLSDDTVVAAPMVRSEAWEGDRPQCPR